MLTLAQQTGEAMRDAKSDEAAILKRAKKVAEQSSCGRGCAGRLAEFRRCVSFFGPDRFDAEDLGWASVRSLHQCNSTLLRGAKGARDALLHYASIPN